MRVPATAQGFGCKGGARRVGKITVVDMDVDMDVTMVVGKGVGATVVMARL